MDRTVLRFQLLDFAYRRPAEISRDHRQIAEQAAGLVVRADSDCKEKVLYRIMQ